MPAVNPVETLRGLHFLRHLDEDQLAEIPVEIAEFEAGERVVQRGENPSALFVVIDGELTAKAHHAEQGPTELYRVKPGDVFGEADLLEGTPYHASLVTNEPSRLIVWQQADLELLLKEHASALESFRFAASSRKLALRLQFAWLGEDELVHGLARKDPNILLQSLSLPFVMLVSGLIGVWWFFDSGLVWVSAAFATLGLALGVWRWIDWGNDYYIVTDRRVVWLEKVIGLYDSRQEAPLHMVLSVSVSTDFLGRTLGYGDVIIRTYTGQITFRNVDDPHSMAAIIEEQWERIKHDREREDREVVVAALRQRLDSPEQPDTAVTPESLIDEPPEPERADETVGLGHWTFEVRFEEDGIITYRKHWAVLMRFIALPSALVMFLVVMLGAHLGGLLEFVESSTAVLGSLILLVPAMAWWVYQYVDWANDIYQITPDQILDVYKKPLSRELRKVAPLENVLGTEVKRKGIFGLMLNYGDVVAQVGTAEFSFEGVLDPNRVQQDIVRAQEAFMERRREVERNQRREELAEWFGVYHEERGPEPEA
jgi:hypothetical protein